MAVRINKDDFEEKVLKSDLPVIVDFYSDSCIACKKLAPYITVSINEEFVPSDEKETTVLKEGDVVEFLYFMGGGC